MDDFSASRFAAHKMGRGVEFDDKSAAREHQRASRGEGTPEKTKKKSSKPPPVSSFRGD